MQKYAKRHVCYMNMYIRIYLQTMSTGYLFYLFKHIFIEFNYKVKNLYFI